MQTLYRFKGTVLTVNELSAIENKNVGDVYKCKADNNDYIWNGQEWINIGQDADFDAVMEQIEKLEQTILNDISKTYTDTTITANTKQGYGRINKLCGTADGVGTLENGRYKVEVISKNGEQQARNIAYVDKTLYEGDYLDYTRKKVVRNCMQTIFNGTENWIKSVGTSTETSTAFWISLSNSKLLKCDKFDIVAVDDIATKEECIVASDTAVSIKIANSKLTTADATGFKAWLASNNVKIVYKLTETLEESVNCSNKIQQFDKETTIYCTDNAEMEVTLSNNKAIAEINGNIAQVEQNEKIYTGQEYVTNTWIDNKRVYKKYYTVKETEILKDNITVISFDTQDLNIDECIDLTGMLKLQTSNTWVKLNHKSRNVANSFETRILGTILQIIIPQDYSAEGKVLKGHVCIEYTKL